MTLACVFGCAGLTLQPEEAAFFRDARPWGFILFRRNVESPEQVRALCQALRGAIDQPTAPVMIDQEGGRVQRLGPPHWRRYPAAGVLAAVRADPFAARELVRLGARLIADDLMDLGVTVDCAPVVDVPSPGGHQVIGDRAYGRTPADVGLLARAFAEGLLAGGVAPVVKHIPGHGRATVDSHLQLPVADAGLAELEAVDLAAFRILSDMPIAMTAHVVYRAIDPQRPATTSRRVIAELIRRSIGFDGLLLSDDLSMNALSGGLRQRARAALAAGCDVALHCNGDLAEMRAVAAGTRTLSGDSAARARAALARLPRTPEPFDRPAAVERFEFLLGGGRVQ